ncbi:putative MCE family protein [Rhodococcus sp. AW25M09]|uniref:MCE family protein n=1 Tax=Rhodococcus sp. AW25M09 TaxID=1268303 RepID=UPI0002ABA0D4|nr:MlaD family protein [Rhodococcus sp. AW25M09]CCQ13510.1 putative MCE family protein [Rhodococcus sp. AW25M09]
MKSIRRPLIGFSVFMVLAIAVTTLIWTTLGRSVAGETNTYAALFEDASGLQSGDDVRIAGVRVGKVEDVSLDGHTARARFILERGQTVYQNTTISIKYQNLIGQRYLALDTSGEATGSVQPGSTIGTDRTEPSFDVSALLNGFQPLFSVLDPEQVNSLSESIVQTLQGDGVSISTLVVQSVSLASEFAEKDEVIGLILTNLGEVLAEVADRGDETVTLIESTQKLMTDLNAQAGPLATAVRTIGDTAGPVADMVDDVRPTLSGTIDRLGATTDLVNGDGAQLRTSIGLLPSVLASFARITENGSFINMYVCNLDVSFAGLLFSPGVFSQVGGTAQSEVCLE